MTKTLTITGALVLLAVALIGRLEGLISDDQLLAVLDIVILGSVVMVFMVLSYGFSWGATQAYKVLYHKPTTWAKESVKRKIYRCAIWSGGMTMLACGSFFLLAENLSLNEKIVVGVFWSLLCTFVGLTSPHLWRFAFENLLPRLRRWARGQDENEAEAEALSRPPEPK